MKNKKEELISLGPVLGVSSDKDYNICILVSLAKLNSIDDTLLTLHVNENQYGPNCKISLIDKYYLLSYKFEKEPEENVDCKVTYHFSFDPNNKYEFSVPSRKKELNIVLVSCNGTDNEKSSKLQQNVFNGWEKLLSLKPNLLVMAGDQVYADRIWNDFPDLKNALKSNSISKDLEDKIDRFYCELYIDSWSNPNIKKAMSSIPTIMTWDDHDIIDGYGSLPDKYQYSQAVQCIFNFAKKYYELFQIRGNSENLLNKEYDYTYTLTYRNYHFVAPDTRSHRSWSTILGDITYDLLQKALANKICGVNKLVFILPVPIAHIKYHYRLEKIIENFFNFLKRSITMALNISPQDDFLDHWEHYKHEKEQIKMLDLMFNAGIRLNVKNLLIFSGDVHFGGAARIDYKDAENTYTATQIISSPIVNKPFNNIFKHIGAILSKTKINVNQYTFTDFNEFGESPERIFNKRNFMIINDLKAHLNFEPWFKNNNYLSRNLNIFNKSMPKMQLK
jgi:phosphodiesterase/alkaline phosphatase D-like protein